MDPIDNYGKYAVPAKLTDLMERQERIKHPHWHLLNQYFQLANLQSRYLNTPLDAISFASPGVDGIHYCFLTDFGTVPSLEDAYIVRVSPMDFGDPVRIVARNIREFLRLLCFKPIAADLMDTRVSREGYEQWNREYPTWKGSYDELTDEAALELIDRYSLEPIDNDLFDYFQALAKERQDEVAIMTRDGIGVVSMTSMTSEARSDDRDGHELEVGENIHWESLREKFLQADLECRLAWVRDMQSIGAFYDQDEMREWTRAQLLHGGLVDEAARIQHPERPKPSPQTSDWTSVAIRWRKPQ